jgi:hypothetical protein
MLNNLKEIYLRAQAFDKGLSIVDMMLMVEPEDLAQFRDRGLLRLQLRQFKGAAKDLEHYIRKADEPQSSFSAFFAALPTPPSGSSSTAFSSAFFAPFLSPVVLRCWPR